MGSEATKIFEIILNNSANLSSEIRLNVYKLLDLEGKLILPNANDNTKLLEQIQASIETFSFNLLETQFLSQVREIIIEEMQKLQTSGNYIIAESSLIERLKSMRNIDVSLENDFKDLSSKIASSFHSQEEYYNYFMAREEKIVNMIKSCNQSILNSLITLTPKLIEEIKNDKEKQYASQESKQDRPSVTSSNPTSDINSKVDEMSKIDELINACKNRYNELQRRFSYLTSSATSNINSSKIMLEKEEIRKALKQLTEFIQKLSANKDATDLMSKYANIKDMNLFCEKIISEIAPSSITATNMTNAVDNIYGKRFTVNFNQFSMVEINVDELHQKIIATNDLTELLNIKQQIESAKGSQYYDTNIRLENELSILLDKIILLTTINSKSQEPNDPMPNINTYVGEAKGDIVALVDSNNFYSILQGIQSYNIEKYRDFIMLGFNIIFNRWLRQAELCNTLVEREKSYKEFVELYENFRDYLPVDMENMLRTSIEDMKKYIEDQRANKTVTDGVRYNHEAEQSNNQFMSSGKKQL